ncbi:TPA: hypothetical protein O1I26_002646 [Staphylococcus aureus]|nr:hypothetical protein [Staphylococcus aureus]HCY2926066.1 hypothetical protein [Staphylococcus aureus]
MLNSMIRINQNKNYLLKTMLLEAEKMQTYLESNEDETTKLLYLLQNFKYSIWHVENNGEIEERYQTQLYVILREYNWIIATLEKMIIFNQKTDGINNILTTFKAMNKPFKNILDEME